MTEALINIYNALGNVETKGESTLIMADCRRALAEVIRQSNNVTEDTPEETPTEG